jgi:hypothetical protein
VARTESVGRIHGAKPQPCSLSELSLKGGQRVLSTKRIRLTRSIFLDGLHGKEGSIHDVAKSLAVDLVAQGPAVQLNVVSRFFSHIRFFVDSRTKRKESNWTVDKSEKAMELLERSAQLGLRVEFRSGLNILEKRAPADPEVITSMMEQLAKYLPEVHDISQRRAVAAFGKNSREPTNLV